MGTLSEIPSSSSVRSEEPSVSQAREAKEGSYGIEPASKVAPIVKTASSGSVLLSWTPLIAKGGCPRRTNYFCWNKRVLCACICATFCLRRT